MTHTIGNEIHFSRNNDNLVIYNSDIKERYRLEVDLSNTHRHKFTLRQINDNTQLFLIIEDDELDLGKVPPDFDLQKLGKQKPWTAFLPKWSIRQSFLYLLASIGILALGTAGLMLTTEIPSSHQSEVLNNANSYSAYEGFQKQSVAPQTQRKEPLSGIIPADEWLSQ